MNSKEIYRFTSIILSIVIISMLVQYSSSQPLSTSPQKDDDNPTWIRPSYDLDLNDIDVENDDESIPKYFVVHTEYDPLNQPNSSEPVRRANFWKRANFWRKRANFWRRNSAS